MSINPIERLDVALPALLSDLKSEQARREKTACLAEQAHLLDPIDAAFARLACEHGDRCSTDADYKGWIPGGTR